MHQYEITVITRDETNAGVANLIQELKGHITAERALGRRQFTYPMHKETAGYYTALRFTLEPDQLEILDRRLRLMNELLRYLIVTAPATSMITADLKIEGLQEAKDLEQPEQATAKTPTPESEANTREREQKLQEQLDKLLANDQDQIKAQ
ncbi:30S ribosomal protein S6 [Candidatus Berkelbacteria bacterium]|nr:30S ribosomal protein S6 [Candidatus Berkelbacteria bacterium]